MSASHEGERMRAAAEWLATLHSRTITNAQLADFARWRRDPGNEAAYRSVEAVWDASAELQGDPQVERLVQEAEAPVRLDRPGRSGGIRYGAAGCVAALLAVALFSTLRPSPPEPTSYRTAIGERADAVLADGSRVRIDTDTVLTAQIAPGGRQVELRRGQAFFDVRHDARRPFVVSAGDGLTVTAVGTRFDVRRMGGAVRVALEEGSVRIAAAGRTLIVLRPGQSVEVTPAGMVQRLDTSMQLLSWRRDRLAFRSTPLVEAVGEMNRYTTGRILIVDAANAQAPVSGDFSVDDPEGFARAVNAVFGGRTVTRSTAAADGG